MRPICPIEPEMPRVVVDGTQLALNWTDTSILFPKTHLRGYRVDVGRSPWDFMPSSPWEPPNYIRAHESCVQAVHLEFAIQPEWQLEDRRTPRKTLPADQLTIRELLQIVHEKASRR